MARAVLVALACCAVRGEQYGASLYGAEYDSGAPAPLDYKYREEPHDDHVSRVASYDGDHSRQSSDRNRRPSREDTSVDLELEESEPEEGPESRKRARHRDWKYDSDRSRRDSRRDGSGEGGGRPGRRRHDSIDERYPGDGDEHNDGVVTTVRVIRRKPRAKYYGPETRRLPSDEEDNIYMLRRPTQADDWPESRERSEGAGRAPAPPPGPALDAPPSSTADSDRDYHHRRRIANNKYSNTYPDYGDYYDMKRVMHIKNKLPTLLRKTTLEAEERQPQRTADLARALWPHRRAHRPACSPLTLATVASPPPDPPPSPSPLLSPSLLPSPPPAPSPSPSPALPPSLSPTPSPILSTSPSTRSSQGNQNDTELSMAEKSRLSILRKAQMKESIRGPSSEKPPVLLNMMGAAPTVVVVEPGTTGEPWRGARRVGGDSPDTLDRVKRLMRAKLVAGAANMRDLTDRWDEPVCDYIDTDMLSRACAADPHHMIFLATALYIILL